jgi:aryl-alcohol dehydrogenase-like predicted oxidoreductase
MAGADARFVSMQNHYNVVYREEEREMLPLCREEGIGVIPFSPHGARICRRQTPGALCRSQTVRAQLTKKYYRDSDYAVVDAIGEVARARGVSNAQVALAWMHAPARRDRAHYWREQASPPGRGRRGGELEAG